MTGKDDTSQYCHGVKEGGPTPLEWHDAVTNMLSVTVVHGTRGAFQQRITFIVPAHPCTDIGNCVLEMKKHKAAVACFERQLPDDWVLKDSQA